MTASKIILTDRDKFEMPLRSLTMGVSTVIDIEDAIYDATSYADVVTRLNNLMLNSYIMLDRVRSDFARYKCISKRDEAYCLYLYLY